MAHSNAGTYHFLSPMTSTLTIAVPWKHAVHVISSPSVSRAEGLDWQ